MKVRLMKSQMGTNIGNKIRDQVCYILVKNLSTFCPCPETSSEDEYKSTTSLPYLQIYYTQVLSKIISKKSKENSKTNV
jgi:hypothetical protein